VAGHSKWAQIKRKKAANDQKRGQIFSKILKEIEVATRLGGANPDANFRLKAIIAKAKAEGVPNDNIQKAIQRGAGIKEGGNEIEEIFYEGMGPENVAFIARALTDNRNRTASEIRHLVSKHGGVLLGINSVRHNFKEKGVVLIKGEGLSEDDILEKVLDFDVEDVVRVGDSFQIVTEIANLGRLQEELRKHFEVEEAGIKFLPVVLTAVSKENSERVLSFLEALDDHDDVQEIFLNADFEE